MNKVRGRRRLLVFAVAVAAVFAAGGWLADRTLKQHRHPGLAVFLKQWWTNYPRSFAVDPPVIELVVKDKGMRALEAVVDRARERGVIMEEGNDYVKGEATVDGATFPIRIRIKGKMTDHVEGRKWSFRVEARDSSRFLGMKRFSLQHPGTRNYLCDWFYHQLMRGEGLIALRYGFCKVTLNGDDLGVYAYEEHFDPGLLEHNGRAPGPIVRFDPDLFWKHRLNGIDGGPKTEDAFGAYQAAALDAYDTGEILKDSVRKAEFERAMALMEAFRRGERKAGEIFDVDRIGRQLAMLDLIGGQQSMDWSDVKFYFDPARERFEPVSYESFSAHPTKQLAAAYRVTGRFSPADDLHTAFFKDEAIFTSYVHHLQRISRKEYLDSAFAALGPALDTASATLYGEFPYKELDRPVYYDNQLAILRLLDVPQGMHAYTQGFSSDTLTLACVPINALPVIIDSIDVKDSVRVAPLGRGFVPCRRFGKPGAPVRIRFVVPGGEAMLPRKGAKLLYHVPGTTVIKEQPVSPFMWKEGMTDTIPAPAVR